MARISLLFFLAAVLALGSSFLSVSGHSPLRFKKFGGYLGGKTHGRDLAEADVEGVQSIYQKISHFFGGYLGGHTHRRELITVGPASPTGGVETNYDESSQVDWAGLSDIIAKEKNQRRELYSTAPASGEVEDSFNFGLGGNDQFDAAGKMRVGGGDDFRPLRQPHYESFASTDA